LNTYPRLYIFSALAGQACKGSSVPDGIQIRRLQVIGEREIRALSDVLIDCVEGGASVSFMWPMTVEKARAFWAKAAESAARGERLIYAAEDGSGAIVGTVQVVLDLPENQPHRGDVSKMLVHRKARKLGVGAALLTAAEQGALAAGKTVLVLDTASDDAERLYRRQGWQYSGTIPDYALMPDGAFCATHIFYKRLQPGP
jgi:GNAT superfamily N-acetyltransferase